MKKVFQDLSRWEFEVEEVSAGVYQAIGRSNGGVVVSSSGIDPEKAISICREKATAVEQNRSGFS